jgi:hypothetical protein
MVAADTSSSGKVAADTSAGESDEVVCRSETITGSKFRKKVCRRVADIEARADEDQAALRQMRSIRSGSSNDTQGIRGN